MSKDQINLSCKYKGKDWSCTADHWVEGDVFCNLAVHERVIEKYDFWHDLYINIIDLITPASLEKYKQYKEDVDEWREIEFNKKWTI